MAAPQFKNLDEYQAFLKSSAARLTPPQCILLATGMAERWFRAYVDFSEEQNWGDASVLRRAIDTTWSWAEKRDASVVDWSSLKNRVQEVTPHMDDFDAYEAMCACVMVQYALECSYGRDPQAAAMMAVLSGLEAVQPDILDEEDLPSGTWKKPALRREIQKQVKLLEHIAALSPERASRSALEDLLLDSQMLGEVQDRAEEPPRGPTNQQIYEQYKKIVQMDMKSAARGMNPRDYPDLAVTLYLGEWMGRYSRRKQMITGEYGKLADQVALKLLVLKNHALDLAEPGRAVWDQPAREIIDIFYSNRHNGLDAASVESPHGYGPSLRRLWVEAKDRSLSDEAAWEAVAAWARHEPAAWGKKAKQPASLKQALTQPLHWEHMGDPFFPWSVQVSGASWSVRLNDFPDEPMYTLLMDGSEAGDFHDWPEAWQRD